MKRYDPPAPLSFYCNSCDGPAVDSRIPESGQFYIQYGHVNELGPKGIYEPSEDYKGVVFALCSKCDPSEERLEKSVSQELFEMDDK